MLKIIKKSLSELLQFNNRTMTEIDRIEYLLRICPEEFSRKDHMLVFKDISSATASRDLKNAAKRQLTSKEGKDNRTVYRRKSSY